MCVCETVCLCESIFFSQTVCSMHQVYMKDISLAVESMAGSKWVGFDANTIRRVVNNAVYMFLVAMETEMCFHSYVRMELALP